MSGRKRQRLQDAEKDECLKKVEVSSATSNLSAMMARMAWDSSTTDLTLICGQMRRQVHSCVLANRSPYFEAAVKRWTNGEKELIVESCNPDVMNMVINYMYGIPLDRQKVEANLEVQESLLEMSRRLLMFDLKAEVEKVLMQNVNKKNFNQMCDFAEDYDSLVLAEHCAKFIVEKNIQPDWKKVEKLPSVAASLGKHIKLEYVTQENLMQLSNIAQKFISNSLAEICAKFILKKDIKVGWTEMEKIPIVTAVVHEQLMDRKANLEVTVEPKNGKWMPATRRLTNKLQLMKENVLKPVWRHQFAWPFHVPVDTVQLGLPDYFDVVKKPMDLGTIRERFKNNFYRNSEEAMEDFNQVLIITILARPLQIIDVPFHGNDFHTRCLRTASCTTTPTSTLWSWARRSRSFISQKWQSCRRRSLLYMRMIWWPTMRRTVRRAMIAVTRSSLSEGKVVTAMWTWCIVSCHSQCLFV